MGIHQTHHLEDAEKLVRLSGTSQSEQNQHRQEITRQFSGGGDLFPQKNAQNIFLSGVNQVSSHHSNFAYVEPFELFKQVLTKFDHTQ
jgi:hypothetical protein